MVPPRAKSIKYVMVDFMPTMDTIISLAKRRGFIFPGSEIYGGLANSWDYGPLGVELKNNIKKEWWSSMVRENDNIVGLDAAILMHPKVWEASGHVAGFSDPLQECQKCHRRFRADELKGESDTEFIKKCPVCAGLLTEPREFNLMFETYMGPLRDEGHRVYLRPETAQGIYVDAELTWKAMRLKPPFGIAQIGKAFRNEITPKNFIYRMREFEQMEMQYFVRPPKMSKAGETPDDIFKEWREKRLAWYRDLGIRANNLKPEDHGPQDLAHYAKKATDILYNFPFGFKELEGIHYRTDFDLKNHMEKSGKDLRFFDEQTKERFVPHVVETSAGADRASLVFLLDAYREEKTAKDTRVVLKFDPRIAPIKVAVLPLQRKPELIALAGQVRDQLKKALSIQYDESGSIGRRYRRQDEIGTPFCATIDFESGPDQSVTVRERDSMAQKRIKLDRLKEYLITRING